MATQTYHQGTILLADFVGYTSLSRRNLELAIVLLEEMRSLIRDRLQAHNGHEIKTIGDALLAEFADPHEATRCALDIQDKLRARNEDADPERTIRVRIGLHEGPIVYRGGDVYGDGVNVASRLQPLAAPGGICLSESIFEQIKDEADVPTFPMGPHDLRGLEEPMPLYQLLMPGPSPSGGESLNGRPAVAVLPFSALGHDPDGAYVAEGLTDELIGALSRLKGLKVISRTSAFSLRDTSMDLPTIGQTLEVDYVLEGSVRRARKRVRVTAQLVRAADELTLWSETYDRALANVFDLEEDLAEKIVESLQLRLLGGRELVSRATDDLSAYTVYLKGRYLWNRRTEHSIREAIACFEDAIERDPDFALAHVGLADAYCVLPDYSAYPPQDAFKRARNAARKARELDPFLAEAHASRANIRLLHEWDWAGAEADFRHAIQLNPGYAVAQHWYAHCLLYTGRVDGAIEWLEQALSLDPLSMIIHSTYGLALYAAHRFDEAVTALEQAIELDPDFGLAHLYLALVHVERDGTDEALSSVEAAAERLGSGGGLLEATRVTVLACQGETEQAQARVGSLLEQAEAGAASPVTVAAALGALGEMDEAFAWIERAYNHRDSLLRFLKALPVFDPLREDPRYRHWLEQLGLPTDD
ncbi:MAG: adenylate/guanylate cyclase domain-containing protein [Candidatus Bipolaricaulia bacterium]